MKQSLALMLVLIVVIGGPSPGAENYRVGATNDLGTQYSNESKDQVRFVVLDLGTTQKPLRITNSGIILFESNPFIGKRWTAGTLETLSAGTVADINEQGTVVGNVTSNAFFNATSFRLRVQPTTPPFTNLAAVWAPGQTGASILDSPKFDFDMGVSYLATFGFLGPSLDPYSCSTIDGQDATGYYGIGFKPSSKFKGSVKESRAFTIDNNGGIYGEAVPDGGFQTYMACPAPDIFGAFLDGFGWGGGQLGTFNQALSDTKKRYDVFGEKRHVFKARNGHTIGDRSYNYVRLPNGNYTNSYTYTVDSQSVSFTPMNLNSHGFVLAVASGYKIVDPANLAAPIATGLTGTINITALNHHEIQPVGSSMPKASPQLVGYDFSFIGDSYDNRVALLCEEDPATGKYVRSKLSRLIPKDTGWQMSYAYDINDAGCIVGQGWYQTVDAQNQPVGNPTFKAVLLKPLEVRDEQDPTKPKIIQPLPVQGPNESNNDYIQRQWPDECIAYIEPHANGGNPEMPHLVVKGSPGIKVRWRLEVEYKRANGFSAPYIPQPPQFTNSEDRVQLPATAVGASPEFTTASDQDWRIFETPDWNKEIADRGFFGGTAKVYMWPAGQTTAPTKPVITFRIGGKSPDADKAKTFIQNHLCDNRLWFAYAIAKKESYGSGEQDHLYYNQFFASYRKTSGTGWDQNKDWQCWAKGWPTYNIDRASRNGPLTSAGGYGVFQVTGDAKSQWTIIPRRELWNWQNNVGYQIGGVWHGAMGILQAKIRFVDARYNPLQQTYRDCGTIPNYPLTSTSNQKRFSGWDAYTCKGYNGYGGTQPQITINGFGKAKQWTVWHPVGSHWSFVDDGYTKAVWDKVEETN